MSTITLISLPIGNLKDITLRALEALKSGKVFYAEDTRVFIKLLEQLGVDYTEKSIDSFHDQSVGKIEVILKRLKAGEDIYLVSDAGSPIVSDPAYPLIKAATQEGVEIKTLPGVTSVITALELSALPPHPFHFWGFIARTSNEKQSFFSKLKKISGTHLFFESPHRVKDTINIFFAIFPEGELVVTRELTKTYESVYRLHKDSLKNLDDDLVEKGEFVILFHQNSEQSNALIDDDLIKLVQEYVANERTPKKLAKIFSKILNTDTKNIYDQLNKSGK